MIILKVLIFYEESEYYEKITRRNSSEFMWFIRCHNAPVYDITGKEVRN